MRVDRVAEDIFVFISEAYVQVTATALLTAEGAIIIDTLPLPAESRQMAAFVASRLGAGRVRYVIHTHHHADHVYGTYLYPEAEVVAHDLGRDLMARYGQAGLARARASNPALAEVTLRLPDLTFRGEMHLHVGGRHLHLRHAPGHSPDGTAVLVVDEKVLVAGDAVMPVPHIARGDIDSLASTLKLLRELQPAFIVQGHGDVLLRGEIDETVEASLAYLETIRAKVEEAVRRRADLQRVAAIDIEDCGLSRIPLDGLVSCLHRDNLLALYRARTGSAPLAGHQPPAGR